MTKRNFLITGVGQGLGRAFAEAAVAAGDRVFGTVRSEEDRARFDTLAPGLAKAFIVDVSDHAAVTRVVAAIEQESGGIDVLINNAGYGHEGVLEESPLDAMRRQFDVNVFGLVAVIKAVLPGMRERRRGHIINLSSMAGLVAFPGIAYYTASKFAVEAISEVLSLEVRDFGVRVTAVAPGSFRTNWAGTSLVRTERSIRDYDGIFGPVREARRQKSGRQVGDPAKAARAVMAIIGSETPPVHLVLGRDALRQVRGRLTALLDELDAWEAVSLSTEHDE